MVLSKFLNIMYEQGWIEVGRFPAYLPDDVIVNSLIPDERMELYIVASDGVFIETFAGSKSFLFNTHQSLSPNPFYSTTEPREKHLLDQKDSV